MTNQKYITSKGKAGEVWYKKYARTEWIKASTFDWQLCCGVHLDFPLLDGSRVWVQDVTTWLKEKYNGKWVVEE